MNDAALKYMHEEMGWADAKIVDSVIGGDESLVLFDNDICLHLRWIDKQNGWTVQNETTVEDFVRNKNSF